MEGTISIGSLDNSFLEGTISIGSLDNSFLEGTISILLAQFFKYLLRSQALHFTNKIFFVSLIVAIIRQII